MELYNELQNVPGESAHLGRDMTMPQLYTTPRVDHWYIISTACGVASHDENEDDAELTSSTTDVFNDSNGCNMIVPLSSTSWPKLLPV